MAVVLAMRHTCTIKGVLRDAHLCVYRPVAEVGHHQRHFSIAMAQVGILPPRVECVLVDIHQIKEPASCQRLLAVAQPEQLAIKSS